MTTAHDAMFDFMAEAYKAKGEEYVPLEQIVSEAQDAGYVELWDMPRLNIVNAMKLRGLQVSSGSIHHPVVAEHYDPIATDFAEFTAAAAKVMAEAEYPLDAADVIERCALADTAIPMASMSHYMRRIGIHLIPGVGYWRSPQYTDPSGRIISRHCRSERIAALLDYFQSHGWPIVGAEAEKATTGLVTSRFLSRFAVGDGRDRIAGIRAGLYVPADRVDDGPIPMSPAVATTMAGLQPDAPIDDHEHLRIYRIAMLMERHGLATLKRSRTTRDKIRRQTLLVKITPAGKDYLAKIAKTTEDEF